ncbi:hypothetical protein [Paraburkholderia mimosarum]|uniref:hypothetical protein n=1 Tax=Paraburkholderia mimosarum TaxID=312026 RepID=UPI000405908F
MINSKRFARPLRDRAPRVNALAALTMFGVAVTAVTLTSGCTMDPPGPSPIFSRLPADQSGVVTTAPALTPDERARYDAIDRQVLAEQDQAMAAEAAAQAWSRAYAPPVTVFGGYSSGGWGSSWGTGIGYGYPGWGWGW